MCPVTYAALRWFYLGISATGLLQQPSGAPFLRALLQLLEEHQYHFASSTAQSIKAIRARGPRTGQVSGGGAGAGASGPGDDIAPSLQRVGGKVLYEFLLTPHLAHAISALQVRSMLHAAALIPEDDDIAVLPCPISMLTARALRARL